MATDTPPASGGSPPSHDQKDGDRVRRTTRAALDVLQFQQRQLVYRGGHSRTLPSGSTQRLPALIEGIETRTTAVMWWQAIAVRTFGYVAEEWPAIDLERDRTLLSGLLGDLDKSRAYRSQLVDHIVAPACQRAYNHLRDRASERATGPAESDPDWRQIDPKREANVGMRPAFVRLDLEQADALGSLFEGFGSRTAISQWLHSLSPATYGELEEDYADDIMSDEYAVGQLVGDDRDAEMYRLRFAIAELLPTFATAARELRAGELSDQGSLQEATPGT
ncbi:hypothetical protein [Halorhabdus amylolytica]|uniref:hypothetical protein n=1 Tax=Halorhabdus amylolytica TaxID=2559573 RepID=UPI0010AB0F5C|nr:hypothetical protein [Halorhabdus amylolytica]